MANTVIQFRRSAATSAPTAGTLAAGQPAYSFVSDKLFLGNVAGSGVDTIGGKYYTGIVDGATSANSANNLVKRNDNGDFAGRVVTVTSLIGAVTGSANTLNPGRYIATTGDAVGNTFFDGSTNIAINVALPSTGITPATYGDGATGAFIPVVTVDAKGRITAISNVATPVGSSFVINGNTGTDTVASGDKVNMYGGDGASVTVSANTGNTVVSIAVDSTVVRTTGTQTVGGNKTFTGDVVFSGTTFYANTTQLNVGDNMVVLNADIPIGVAPSENAGIEVNRGNTNANASIYWDETNDWWTAVSNTILSGASALGRIHTDSYANATALSIGTVPSTRITGSYTGITGVGTITTGTWSGSNINVQFGGTGRTSFALNGIVYGAGANGALLNTSAPTEGQILQGNISGVPTFGGIDGGTY